MFYLSKTIKRISFYAIAMVMCLGIAAAAASSEQTFKDVAYGPHARDVLDFFQAKSDQPTPLIIYIHGGGFYLGSKEHVSKADIQKCLAAGVSIASISYPYYMDVPLHGIIRDHIARALQFLRYNSAKYNIDKTKVAVFGHSAGAASSLWLAFHDDIADLSNPDPVLRESTRVVAAGAQRTQATYDFLAWDELFKPVMPVPVYKGWKTIMIKTILDMYHVKREKDLLTEEMKAMRRDLDFLSLMDKNDSPVFIETFASELNPADILHHIQHAKTVKKKCDEVGVDCTLIVDETPAEQRIDTVDFLLKYLK